MPIDLFTHQVDVDTQHAIFKMMNKAPYGPERAIG